MFDGILWILGGIAHGPRDLVYALGDPASWLDWSDPQAILRFAYYGGSSQVFFVAFDLFLLLLALGLWRRGLLWGFVRGAEAFANAMGRLFAWAGLAMVLQQVVIVFLQRVFLVSQISVGPFGTVFTRDLSWYSEELKLYNAMIVALCCAWTFVQGGHVRVDLVYARVTRRSRKIIDAAGSLVLMAPMLVLSWLYAWFFLWRHLITPKISASDSLEAMLRKSRVLKWNVETIGFSPNGFDAYFLFKLLILAFIAMMLLQAVTFFFRNVLELVEGPEADGRFHDPDRRGEGGPPHPAETM
ncbi:MAG: TRAP transporter small permease subunit [Rhodobacteraceae bacterium]|nr:TRAP transporter small permease subunit [Paracoccaceae bacterium]